MDAGRNARSLHGLSQLITTPVDLQECCLSPYLLQRSGSASRMSQGVEQMLSAKRCSLSWLSWFIGLISDVLGPPEAKVLVIE